METTKRYNLDGYVIVVIFRNKLISIQESQRLFAYLAEDIEGRSAFLAELIKQDYGEIAHKKLSISTDSLIMEIWGHLYASHLARAIKTKTRIEMVTKIADFIITRGDIIDCGERGVDKNRWIWNILSNFKGAVLKIAK